MNENVNVRNRKAVVEVFKIFQQNSRISYLANSASAETLIGMLAMTSPPSPSLGSITWHFRMGCSLMWTSLLDLNDTVTGWGRSFMFRVILLGFTVNKSQGLGFLGSQLSKTKLQIFSGCYSSTILLSIHVVIWRCTYRSIYQRKPDLLTCIESQICLYFSGGRLAFLPVQLWLFRNPVLHHFLRTKGRNES